MGLYTKKQAWRLDNVRDWFAKPPQNSANFDGGESKRALFEIWHDKQALFTALPASSREHVETDLKRAGLPGPRGRGQADPSLACKACICTAAVYTWDGSK